MALDPPKGLGTSLGGMGVLGTRWGPLYAAAGWGAAALSVSARCVELAARFTGR